MAAGCKQTFEDLATNTQRHLGYTPRALSDYTRYSIQNNITTATLPSSYSTMDGQSVFVSSDHTRISTTKSSTHMKHFLSNRKSKRHVGGSDVTEYPVSKARDLVIPCVKNTAPGHAPLENRRCLHCLRLQLYLVTCRLFLND